MSAIDELASELARLPGIGRKTALRLTYHLLRQPREQTRRLAEALLTLGERVRPCSRCYNLTEEELCTICRDPRRDAATICVVAVASPRTMTPKLNRIGYWYGSSPSAPCIAATAYTVGWMADFCLARCSYFFEPVFQSYSVPSGAP